MPVSLSLYLYRRYQRKVQERFSRHNTVLGQKDIERLIADGNSARTLRIFRSAIVDHVPVEGRPYYLRYPLESVFYHDGFKQALIADRIASLVNGAGEEARRDALVTLEKLVEPQTAPPYVHVLAWHSLGMMMKSEPSLAQEKKEAIIEAFGGRSGSLLGALLVIEKLLEEGRTVRALEIFAQGRHKVRYRVQMALVNAFMFHRREFADPLDEASLEGDIRHFLNRLNSRRYFTQEEIREGLREIGLIPMHLKPELWEGVPQQRLAQRLEAICRCHIGAMGAFIKRW